MPLLLAAMIGVSGGLIVWSLRGFFQTRWDRDVAWLEHAIWRLTPEPFNGKPWVAGYYITVALSVVAWSLLPPKILVGLVVLAIIILPRPLLGLRWKQRRKQINEQLPEAVLQMSGSVASGMTLTQAIERLAKRAATPIRTEFRIMANQWELGSDFRAVIEEQKRRLGLERFNLFASTVLVNQLMGGNITETLERLAYSLEAIDRMQRDVHAATSEGRTNVKVLLVTPLVMLGFVELMDHEAVLMLFTTPVGGGLMGVAGLLTVVGALWAWSIANADV